MHSIFSPLERARPSQNLLRVVIMVRVRRSLGKRVENLVAPLERRDITKTKDRSLNRINPLRVFNKILVGVVHLTLVLLKVVMEQVPTFWGTVTLVGSLAINLLSAPSNYLQDLVRVQRDLSLL